MTVEASLVFCISVLVFMGIITFSLIQISMMLQDIRDGKHE